MDNLTRKVFEALMVEREALVKDYLDYRSDTVAGYTQARGIIEGVDKSIQILENIVRQHSLGTTDNA